MLARMCLFKERRAVFLEIEICKVTLRGFLIIFGQHRAIENLKMHCCT